MPHPDLSRIKIVKALAASTMVVNLAYNVTIRALASRSWSVSWTVKVFPFIWPLEVADGSGSHPLHAGASFSILPGQACLERNTRIA